LIGKEILDNFTVKINKKGYSILTAGNTTQLKNLKRRMLKLKVPYLKRKWDTIDLTYKSNREDTPYKIKIIKLFLPRGKTQRFIAKKLGVGEKALSIFIKKHNLKNPA
jgi:hypothetical protein